jgi:hypothetical protein
MFEIDDASHETRVLPRRRSILFGDDQDNNRVQPECSRSAAGVQPECSRSAARVQPECSRSAARVQPYLA